MRRRRLAALALPAALVAAALTVPGTAGTGPAGAAPPEPARSTIAVAGLGAPVEMVVDRWGVPHVYAASKDDAFFAQGFNAARDRLFQIDTFRRRGLGQLSEVLGPAYVKQDRATRLFLYRGSMRKEWASYGPEARQIATRFTQGINAYLDHLAENPALLPPEFERLGYQPSRWSPSDVVRIRSHGLTRNVAGEVARAQVACAAGLDADRLRQGLQPAKRTRVPVGLDPCDVPEDVLDVFDLATQGVTFEGGPSRRSLSAAAMAARHRSDGSNNWVVGPERTETGRPLLANDPHRAYSTPSLRYLSHLSAPGMDVIGANEPSLPGISIGHNQQIAFGLTIFPMDQEDLYVYRLHPRDADRYWYRGRWTRMRTVTERVRVAGGKSRTVTMRFTRHGPVLKVDRRAGRAFALRTAWAEPGMAPYFGSVKYMLADDYRGFVRDMRNWGAPTENQVYADTSGTIAWVPGGLAPRRNRADYDGLLPVPGDGRYEWSGFYSGDDLPRVRNPRKGFFATNNEYNLPRGWPARRQRLGFEWTNPYRNQRTERLLAGDDRVSVSDSEQIQNDQLSLPARRITRLLGGLRGGGADARAAVRMLRGWDHVEGVDSAPAALFEVWLTRHLGPGFVERAEPEAAELIGAPDTRVLIGQLKRPGRSLGSAKVRDRLLLRTLAAAWRDVEERLGPDPAAWRWGDLQKTVFEHPFHDLLDEAEQARYDVGRLDRGGSEFTVNQSSYDSETFEQTNGPSFRMVLDVGNWDASTAVNTPGQSGDPDDPHYRDLAGSWQRGEYFPLLYSRDAVLQHAEQVITLQPR